MQIDFENLDPISCYQLMIQTIVPRPIAWVLSKNENKSFNLAPFSYFNALTSAPPLFMISIGYRKDKTKKDTRANIEREKEFVVHIASSNQADQVTHTSLAFDKGVSEVTEAGITLEESPFNLPRIKEAKVAMYCHLEKVIEIGANNQGIVFGEIKSLYIDDNIVSQENGVLTIDALALDPLGRLGGNDYGTLGETKTVDRPAYTPN